jgi:HlyD family secretion protein
MEIAQHAEGARKMSLAQLGSATHKKRDGISTATTAQSRMRIPRWAIVAPVAVLVVAGGVTAWYFLSRPALPAGFAAGNGRLEANQIYISNKYAGRVAEVLVNEGDDVNPGQMIARMDTSSLDAQLREAVAQIKAAQDAHRVAQDARKVAQAQVGAKQADYDFAASQDSRSRSLLPSGAVSKLEAEQDHASSLSTRAQLTAAQTQVVQSEAQIDAAAAQIDATVATADRLRAEIKDAVLVSPIRGRVETRMAEPGEVLPAGGRVYSVNDLSDVYMYVYLPASVTGKVPLGSEARIVMDAAPQYPVRAYVSYVSPLAQFTPKTVETAEERHNLTFRVKLQLPRDKLRQYESLVKSGLPGTGYVRWKQDAPWPAKLQSKTPPANLWQPTGSSTGAQ